MPRIIDLPYVGTPTQATSFVATKDLITGRVSFPNLAVWTGHYLGIDQELSTQSDVEFNSVTAPSLNLEYAKIKRTLSIGGTNPSTVPDSLHISNNFLDPTLQQGSANIKIVNFRDNNSTEKNYPHLSLFNSGGTPLQTSETLKDNKLFSIEVRGSDNEDFVLNQTGEISFAASQDFRKISGVTNRAGTTFKVKTQPSNIVLNSNSQFTHIRNEWTTSTDSIIRNNIYIGDGGEGGVPTLTTDIGLTQVGHGSTNLFVNNSFFRILGVPNESTEYDNLSLRDTNRLIFVTSRRNSLPGRRDPVKRNDSIGRIDFRASYLTSSTDTGAFGGSIIYSALDDWSTSTRGTNITVITVNSSTNTTSNRLELSNISHIYNSEIHVFKNNSGTTLASLSTSEFVVNVPFSSGIEGLGYRVNVFSTATSLGVGTTATLEISGYKTYVLSKVSTNYPSRVRIYSDSNSRTNDFYRLEGTVTSSNSGVVAEVITTSGSLTNLITPGIIGFSNELPTTTTVYLSITNKDVVTRNILVTLTLLQLEI